MVSGKDKRLEIFCSRTKEAIFHGITHHNQVWRPDPYDVESIHEESRNCYERLLKRVYATEPSDSGRVLLLLGESGSGKTHLMRAFRNYTHEKALGYFAYMQMTSSASNYARYALHYTIDSLDKPYFEPNGSLTGFMRLSNALIEGRKNIVQNDIDLLRSNQLTQNELINLVYKITDNILNSEAERFHGIDLDLMHVIIYLQNSNPAIHARIRKYLRCEDLTENDRFILGGISPRLHEEDPQRILQALAQLIFSVDAGALVVCLDQLEDIHSAENVDDNFRRAMQVMTMLAQMPNVIVVIACLDNIYQLLKNNLPNSYIARIEQDPDTIFLKAERNADEIRNLITVRLQDFYESEQTEIDPADLIFPFPEETPNRLSGMSIRNVLNWCRQQREQSIKTGQPPCFQDPSAPIQQPDPDPNPPIPDGPLELIKKWNDYVAEPHLVPDEETELLQLLNRAIAHCATELNKRYQFITAIRDIFLDIEILGAKGIVNQQLTVGICQKSPQGGALSRQIDQLQNIANDRKAVAIRSIEFPSDPKTKIAKRLGEFVAAGGKKVTVSDSDWRTMVAMESFQKQYGQQPEFQHWLHSEQPLLSLPSFQEILTIENMEAPSESENSPEQYVITKSPSVQPSLPSSSSKLRVGTFKDDQANSYLIQVSQLVRHAAFLGSPGSGKTTLALNIIEQLLLQGIPAILLDRKGDLCSYAKEEVWRSPVVDLRLKQKRKDLSEQIDVVIYTPGAIEDQGRSLSIPVVPSGLGSLPSGEREHLANHAAFSLGKIMGYKDHGQDKSRIIIIGQAISILSELNQDKVLTLKNLLDFIDKKDPRLLNAIGKLDPKLFNKLVQDLQTLELGNGNLFAQSGELLNTESLFGRSPNNKPNSNKTRLSIISTASLGSNENVLFWVSQLLIDIGRFAARSPSDKLQGVILFDEADLYLPAQSKPATKEPLESLLKRARSAGIGILLATQSPGDLDYKSRDQVSSWFIGCVKENTALNKLKPMLSEAKTDVTNKLANQSIGEFFAIYNGDVKSIKADPSLIQAKQVPSDEILKLASKKSENRSSFFAKIFSR